VAYKSPAGGLATIPEKFYMQLRFFTFQPVNTEYMEIQYNNDRGAGGVPQPRPSQPYFL